MSSSPNAMRCGGRVELSSSLPPSLLLFCTSFTPMSPLLATVPCSPLRTSLSYCPSIPSTSPLHPLITRPRRPSPPFSARQSPSDPRSLHHQMDAAWVPTADVSAQGSSGRWAETRGRRRCDHGLGSEARPSGSFSFQLSLRFGPWCQASR